MADLEKRKRAPLYQKKQEEELKAAVDKAADAEVRAAEAEARYKEAKVGGGGGVLGVYWECVVLGVLWMYNVQHNNHAPHI